MKRCLLLLVAVTVLATAPAAIRRAQADRPDPVRCGHLERLLVGGVESCTHGSDPAPDGIDLKVPQPLASSTPTFVAGSGPSGGTVPCYGDGVSGKRVQALYVRPSDVPDRSAQVIPSIRRWAADVDDVFNASAGQTGASRHVRFLMTPACTLDVRAVTVAADADVSIATTIAALALQGYSRPDRKYLVWMDSTILCGIANFYIDDRAGVDNANNGNGIQPGTVARIDSGCWGLASRGESVEAHELTHGLGGVQPTAPHATTLGHCTDDSDRMCYDDGSPLYRVTHPCPAANEAMLDCGHDDYFDAAATPKGYLATHWNTARSSFLEANLPVPVPGGDVTRLAGRDRVATAIAASGEAFSAGSAGAAVLSVDRSFADALAGVPLAAARGGPLLLTSTGSLDSRVADELRRVLRPKATVYLLGGRAALSDAVGDAVRAAGFPVVRFGGTNRFATAVQIAEDGLGGPSLVIEATGLSFPDALAAGAAAAAQGGAVLLTNGSVQSLETAAYLVRHPLGRRVALGGPAASADPTAERLAGADRYATATMVARTFFPSPDVIGVASGTTFPDALAGGANIAAHEGPVLLAAPDSLPSPLVDYVRATASVSRTVVYGGAAALSDGVTAGMARLTAGRT